MSLKFVVSFLAVCLGSSLTIVTFAGFAGAFWWGFDLLDHFRWQYCWLFLVPLLIGVWFRQRFTLLFLPAFLVNVFLVGSLAIPHTEKSAGQQISVFHANIDFTNPSPGRVLAHLNSTLYDVILLQEVTPDILPILEEGLPGYRMVIANPKNNSHGSAMFVPEDSTLEITHSEVISFDRFSKRPLIVADIEFEGLTLSLMSIHLTRPSHANSAGAQKREFAELATWADKQKEKGKSVVIIGDFNVTPWSQMFLKLLQDANLRNSQQGYALQMTWPNHLPKLFQIAIDHAVHSNELVTTHRVTGPDLGSDHLPLAITLVKSSDK